MTERTREFRILAGVDGSSGAAAAISSIVEGPWPAARVRLVVARQTRSANPHSILLSTLDRSTEAAVEHARRRLARRWPAVEAEVVNNAPVEGLLSEARKFRADLIVVGWRGHGPARRLLVGSVSRGVVRGATCAVLVVKRPTAFRNVVLAFDGSSNAWQAVKLIARLAPRDGRVTLVQALELITRTSRGPAVAGIRASIDRGVKRLNAERSRAALTGLNQAARELNRAGWRTRTELRTGEPLRELFDAIKTSQADLLVAGARGTSGVRQLLLGSVAEGALNQSPVPVLFAR